MASPYLTNVLSHQEIYYSMTHHKQHQPIPLVYKGSLVRDGRPFGNQMRRFTTYTTIDKSLFAILL